MTESCEIESGQSPSIQPDDRLFVPHKKRFSHAYENNDEGVRELRLYYGLKEVSFDEEHLFPFGEALVRQSDFVAHSATGWGPGYAWDELEPLLGALVSEGILKRGEIENDERGGGLAPSLLPPSQCPYSRTWSAAECESISLDLGGRATEIGYLESIIPVYRIVHPSLDSDDRQVGEANVFPARLRLDRETEWRTCQYPGSRYRDDAPMNVTALKAMIKHWKPMMTMLLAIKDELQKRLPRAAAGHSWTVGDLHTLAVVVLSVPAYQQTKGDGSAPPRPIHPVLSSLFRITDGIRMTTHEMLFLSAERTRDPAEPLDAAELYAFAERNGLFLSEAGVCAGPKAMIDEFLSIAVDGAGSSSGSKRGDLPAISELPLELQALVAELPAAVDYALYGLQIWCLSRASWLAMSRAYKQLHQLGGEHPSLAAHPLHQLIDRDWHMMNVMRIALDHEREVHATVYRDGYEQAWRALRQPLGYPSYDQSVAPLAETAEHRRAGRALADRLAAALPSVDEAAHGAIAATLLAYLREEQAALAAVTALQRVLEQALGRPRPARPLSARDFRLYHAMRGGISSDFPYLFDSLERELGFRVECTALSISISDRQRDNQVNSATG